MPRSIISCDLIETIAQHIQTTFPERIILVLHIEEDLPSFPGDTEGFRRGMLQLIENALETRRAGPRVLSIEVRLIPYTADKLAAAQIGYQGDPGEYIEFDISAGADIAGTSGNPCPPDLHDTLLECNGVFLVDALPGGAAHYKVLFPVAPPAQEAPQCPPDAPGEWNANGLGILLVDDEETMIGMTRLMLEHLGFTVHSASGGLEAVAQYHRHKDAIALILLDLNMPYMSGEETLSALREINPAVRVIISSGYAGKGVLSRFGDASPAGFIHKPYSLAELRREIMRVLDIA